jgi:hypothetical protein
VQALLLRLLALLGETLSVTLGLNSLLTNPNGPNSLVSIGTELRALQVYDADSALGLPAVLTDLVTIDADIVSARTAILAAIAALPSGSGPVTLPTIPPAGYGAPDATGIFNAVWNTGQTIGGQTAWPWLQAAGKRSMFHLGYASYDQADENFAYFFTGVDDFGVAASFFPVWDTPSILAGDTLLSYLTRLNPGAIGVFQPYADGAVHINGNTGDGVASFITIWTEVTFKALQAVLFGGLAPSNEALWPGLANVTLGTPVDLATALTITTPMNGVIVNLTGVPAKASWFDFDGTLSYRNLGQLAFETDNGNFDLAQSLGFTTALYVPRSMYLAAGVKMRTVGGVTGTVTPWVIV